MTHQTIKPTLEEYCGNCDLFVWHDLLLEYVEERGRWELTPIHPPRTGSCAHMLMKYAHSGKDVTQIECLFWSGGAE